VSTESSIADPFLERLKAHAQTVRDRPPIRPPSRPTPQPAARTDQLAFWQSPVVRAALNRRITGDATVSPEVHFVARHAGSIPSPQALTLRVGDARLEVALIEAGACERITGLDADEQRALSAQGNVPDSLREQIDFRQGDPLAWEPEHPLGAVIARSVLHRQADLSAMLDHVHSIMAPGALVFVDEFVGPARFQWTELQIEVINRLLACMPEELLIDLGAREERRKTLIARPDPAKHALSNPSDAVCSDQIVGCLDERFERVEVSLYGGAVYHQLFSRVMGNFAPHPELVRVIMEVDALLTDTGVLASDYVWGVWRRP
jgi:SAM-dependent methyltransferase